MRPTPHVRSVDELIYSTLSLDTLPTFLLTKPMIELRLLDTSYPRIRSADKLFPSIFGSSEGCSH